MNHFSSKLITIRKILGFNQKEMADILSISRPTYSRIESNQSDISAMHLDIMFKQLHVSPLWFFSEIEPVFLQIFDNEKADISKFLKMHTLLIEIQQKIKIQGEKTFWQNIFDSFEGAFELFSKALNKDFTQITIKDAKKTLIDTVVTIPLNKFGFGINTYEIDKNKLLHFIEGLDDMECFIILSNAQNILATINQSRMILNRRS